MNTDITTLQILCIIGLVIALIISLAFFILAVILRSRFDEIIEDVRQDLDQYYLDQN